MQSGGLVSDEVCGATFPATAVIASGAEVSVTNQVKSTQNAAFPGSAKRTCQADGTWGALSDAVCESPEPPDCECPSSAVGYRWTAPPGVFLGTSGVAPGDVLCRAVPSGTYENNLCIGSGLGEEFVDQAGTTHLICEDAVLTLQRVACDVAPLACSCGALRAVSYSPPLFGIGDGSVALSGCRSASPELYSWHRLTAGAPSRAPTCVDTWEEMNDRCIAGSNIRFRRGESTLPAGLQWPADPSLGLLVPCQKFNSGADDCKRWAQPPHNGVILRPHKATLTGGHEACLGLMSNF